MKVLYSGTHYLLIKLLRKKTEYIKIHVYKFFLVHSPTFIQNYCFVRNISHNLNEKRMVLYIMHFTTAHFFKPKGCFQNNLHTVTVHRFCMYSWKKLYAVLNFEDFL